MMRDDHIGDLVLNLKSIHPVTDTTNMIPLIKMITVMVQATDHLSQVAGLEGVSHLAEINIQEEMETIDLNVLVPVIYSFLMKRTLTTDRHRVTEDHHLDHLIIAQVVLQGEDMQELTITFLLILVEVLPDLTEVKNLRMVDLMFILLEETLEVTQQEAVPGQSRTIVQTDILDHSAPPTVIHSVEVYIQVGRMADMVV